MYRYEPVSTFQFKSEGKTHTTNVSDHNSSNPIVLDIDNVPIIQMSTI